MKKRRLICTLLITFALVLLLPAMKPLDASAASKKHYIRSVSDLKKMYKDRSGTYYLKKCLDLKGAEWTPVGTESNPFTGKFYGQGHTIKNLKVSKKKNYAGLFGYTKGAVITKVRVLGKVTNVQKFGGGIVGLAANTKISYCISKVSVTGVNQVGGIVGRLSNSSIKYCINSSKVTATGRCAGGIAADIYPSGTISYCLNVPSVSGGTDLTGGITGGSTDGPIEGCVNVGNITCISGRRGGIAGDNTLHAGTRKQNYFRKTYRINQNLVVVGSDSGTFTDRKAKVVTSLRSQVKKYFHYK